MRRLLCGLATALCCTAGAAPAAPAQRVVSLGGALTEIVFALGAGGRLVGVDSSSIYPPAATRLPQVGYYRSFSVEGVASLRPDLVLASDQAGPPPALAQLERLGQPVVVLPSAPTLPALDKRIAGVAAALGLQAEGARLNERLRTDVAEFAQSPRHQRVLLLSSHTGKLQGAGAGTAADAVLQLVGATNVLAASQGYKPLSAEALAALRPEVIVTTTMSIATVGGLNAFLAQPGVAVTPAARAGRVVVLDDLLLLGFGPRLPEALRLLRAGIDARP